jgi:hypothetical protein
MNKLTLDSQTTAQFQGLSDSVEVCDPAGRTLGFYLPLVEPALYQNVRVPFTEAELDRFEQERGGRSLAAILADLERTS